MYRSVLAIIIPILALVDGLVHLTLDLTVFHGNFTQNTLSELFLLNFLGYVVLIVAFFLISRLSASWRSALDVLMIVYAAVTFFEWVSRGGPNPMGLAYVAKPAEILLVVALVAHVLELRGGEARSLAA